MRLHENRPGGVIITMPNVMHIHTHTVREIVQQTERDQYNQWTTT